MRTTRSLQAATALLTTLVALVLLAGIASAHVTVDPKSAAPGTFTVLTFRVPNERNATSTTSLKVTMPSDHPIPSVSVQPVAGWNVEVTRAKPAQKTEVEGIAVDEVVTSVTWSGGEIKPGQFQEFKVSVGPLPSGTSSLVFPTQQTYSDGEVVDWTTPTTPGEKEPERPAPTLTLATTPSGTATSNSESSGTNADVDAATTRANVAVILGALGVAIGIGALIAARRRSSETTP